MLCKYCGAEIDDLSLFCGRCGAILYGPSSNDADASHQNGFTTSGISEASKGAIDVNKVVRKIGMAILCRFIELLMLNVVISLLLGYNIFVHLLGLISGCFVLACLFAIPEVIVIVLRISTPGDTAYEIGSTQDKQTNRMFEQKYERFKLVANTVIWIIVVAIQIYFFYTTLCVQYPKEMQEIRSLFLEVLSD